MASHSRRDVEILIAEDSATQAEQLKYLLEQQGYVVTATLNGKQALEAARKRKPTLIISDIVMPEMDGYELCRAVKSDPDLKDVPVIILTTLSTIQDIATSLECGADNFLRKPYDEQALLARIDNILSNWELRKGNKMRMGLEIYLGGKKHFITSEREQILDLLISSYEQAIQMNEELKLREQEVRTLNADLELHALELEETNKELESFSYSVSHDLRAPLRAIEGFSRILEEDYGPGLDDEGRRLLKTVRDNSLRMAQLIADLLEFSRWSRQPIASRRVDMTLLAQEVFQEIQVASAGSSLRVAFAELPVAWGDASLIRQVWSNLLSNAVKYSGARQDPLIVVSAQVGDQEHVYSVKDNGAGFDMQYYDKLFGVFQRLHRDDEFPGTGVGLAIVTPQGVLPIYPCAKVAGPAATLKLVPAGQSSDSTVLGTLRAIVKGGAGSVLVIDASDNPGVNAYGGVAGATSRHHGLVGCVTDGVVRDVDEYKGYGMPVYARGIAQQSVRGRSSCAGYGIEVKLGGVRVRPGDFIVADENGTVVIPMERVAEVLAFAQKVKATEERVIAEIRAGADPVEAHEKVNYDNMLKTQPA